MKVSSNKSLTHISDTAIWAAYFRAMGNDRHHGLFSDPFANRLIGNRGQEIVKAMPGGSKMDIEDISD